MSPEERLEVVRDRHDNIDKTASESHRNMIEHIRRLEHLEVSEGLDLDVFTDVYGESSLDGDSDLAQNLAERWDKLYDSLTQPGSFVLIYNVYEDDVLKHSNAAGYEGLKTFNVVAERPDRHKFYEAAGFFLQVTDDTELVFAPKSEDGASIKIVGPKLYVFGVNGACEQVPEAILMSEGKRFNLDLAPVFDYFSTLATGEDIDEFYVNAFVHFGDSKKIPLIRIRQLFEDTYLARQQ